MEYFEVNSYETKSIDTLISKLRQVKLNNAEGTLIYKNADIKLCIVTKDMLKDLYKSQLYLLRNILDVIEYIKEDIETKLIYQNNNSNTFYFDSNDIPFKNIFTLNGYLELDMTMKQSLNSEWEFNTADFLPPIFEYSVVDNGIWLLNDGMHRMYSSLEEDIRHCIFIRDDEMFSKYPYYALPHSNKWNEVEVYDKVPDIKKQYRQENYRELFRDFNSVFNNVSRKR